MESKALTSSRETPYFIFCVFFSVFIYLIATISIIGIGIILLLLGLVLFSNAIMIGNLRGNGVRIHEKQFPEVYERVVALSEAMNLKKVPDVFVLQSEGALNAFATRFMGRNMVVIYSEVFELAREQNSKELDFIIAHELAHIKRRHIWKNILIMPANFIPFLSEAYSRACEYTCDRKAAYYIEDGQAAKNALKILGIGKLLYKDISEHDFLEQIHSESNVAVWFAEITSSHPTLPKRIQAIGQFMQMEDTPNFRPDSGKIAIGAVISIVVLSITYIGAIVYLVFSIGILSTFTSIFDRAFWYEDDFLYDEEEYGTILPNEGTPLMDAAALGELENVETLIQEGADIHIKDEDQTSALHYAVYNDEYETAERLLIEGANPNDSDLYSTVLSSALFNGSYDIAALLYDFGADPEIRDADGDSALDLVNVNSVDEFKQFLSNPY